MSHTRHRLATGLAILVGLAGSACESEPFELKSLEICNVGTSQCPYLEESEIPATARVQARLSYSGAQDSASELLVWDQHRTILKVNVQFLEGHSVIQVPLSPPTVEWIPGSYRLTLNGVGEPRWAFSVPPRVVEPELIEPRNLRGRAANSIEKIEHALEDQVASADEMIQTLEALAESPRRPSPPLPIPLPPETMQESNDAN